MELGTFPNFDRNVVGNFLRGIRVKEGMTVMELAIILGITPTALQDIESGKVTPSEHLKKVISEAFNVIV